MARKLDRNALFNSAVIGDILIQGTNLDAPLDSLFTDYAVHKIVVDAQSSFNLFASQVNSAASAPERSSQSVAEAFAIMNAGSAAPLSGGVGPNFVPTDTNFVNQWYLNNTGAGFDLNVTKVWDDYTGAGVTVTTIDNGYDFTHADLAPNYDQSRDYDFGQGDADASAFKTTDNHGTAVMGIIGAAINGTGVVGVAYESTMIGFRTDFSIGGATLNAIQATAFTNETGYQATDVVNMSYGATTSFNGFGVSDVASLIQGTATGRDGLGTIYVKSAGNSRSSAADSSGDGNSAAFQSITVAAVLQSGSVSLYSTTGSANLISAFGSSIPGSIFTTDRVGGPGYSSGDFAPNFNGTSAAAPMISGIVALMLEANPDLGWRDVQTILAYSARQVGTAVDAAAANGEVASGAFGTTNSWLWNAADNWNGGGLHFSNDYGYGLVDALAAVRLAETWEKQSTSANLVTGTVDFVNSSVDVNPTAGGLYTWWQAAYTFDATVEYVSVSINFTTLDDQADLRLYVISPDGTVNRLTYEVGGPDNLSGFWTFGSNAFRGENSVGTWEVRIEDRDDGIGSSIVIDDLVLNVSGEAANDDDLYIFTDEYSDYDGVAGHTTLFNGGRGSNTINAAAVTSNTTLNFLANTGTIDGVAITNYNINRAFTGDGNDTIIGDGVTVYLDGGRGNDTITGGSGSETLVGGFGADTINGGNGNDIIVAGVSDNKDGVDTVNGGAGDDTITGGFYQDIVNGDAGDDTFIYLNNDFIDIVDGGADTDTVDFSGYDTVYNWTVDLTAETHTRSTVGAATALVSVENINAGGGNDTLTGSSAVNIINGGDGDDIINGIGSGDTINGQGGDDTITITAGATLNGGTGNDTFLFPSGGYVTGFALDGGDDIDLLDFTAFGGSYQVDLAAGTMFTSGATNMGTLTLIENVSAGNGNDTLTGDDVANVLDGGGGNDTLAGGLGADTLIGGAGTDTADYSDSNEAVQIGQNTGILTGGHAAGDTLSGIEIIRGSDFGDAIAGGGGDTLDQTFYGGLGNDNLEGLYGIDRLYGEGGNDTLRVASSDTFGATEVLDGGADTDILLAYQYTGDLDVMDLRAGTIASIETLQIQFIFSEILDEIIFNADQLTFTTINADAHSGESVRFSVFMDGDTTLDMSGITFNGFTETGDGVTINGNAVADTITGSSIDDIILAGDGEDTLFGSDGADVMDGGDGIDTVDYSGSSVGVIVKVLPNSGVGGTAQGDTYVDIENVIGSSFGDLIEGTGGVNILDGGNGDDDLYGFFGADTLLGGSGNDRLRYAVSNGDFLGTLDGGTDTDELYIFGSAASADMRGATITDIETLTFEAGFNNDYGVQFDVSQFIFATIEADNSSRGTETLNIDLFMNFDTVVDFGSLAFVNFGTVNDTLSIFGDADAETITGSSVNDIIEGGDGADIMDGGLGSNTVSYAGSDGGVTINLEAQTASGNHADGDTLTNFQNAIGSAFDDTIAGSSGDNVLNGGLGFDTVDYSNAAAGVTVDLTNSGQQDTVGAGLDTLIGFEFVTGSAHDDTLTIGANGQAFGGGGDDAIYDTSGQPVFIDGQSGNDTIFVGTNIGVGSTWDGGADIDLLDMSAVNFDLSGFRWSINLATNIFSFEDITSPTSAIFRIENVIGTLVADLITGDDLANVLDGNDGDDELIGGLGNDTLIGGLGADILNGGDGTDTADYSAASSALRVDLTTGTVSGYALGDTFVDIENLIGGAFNDFLTGTSSGNVIEGGDGIDDIKGLNGNDTLIGGAGDDLLYGNADQDTLIGGLGADLHHGGNGTDTASYVDATGAVRVDLSNGNVGGYALGDTFVSIENLTGGAFDDILTGDANANLIRGEDGNDTLKGLDGNDNIRGGDGDDTIFGNADNDTLRGEAGDDTLNGGSGNDTFLTDDGADVYIGGGGFDRVTYKQSSTGIYLNMFNTALGTGWAAGDVLTGIEKIEGSLFDDIMTGGLLNDSLYGEAGDDELNGGQGNDRLFGGDDNDTLGGGSGSDKLFGEDGDDILFGGTDNDQLYGGDGNDILRGGDGFDILIGGDGADQFIGGAGFDRATYKQATTGLTIDMSDAMNSTLEALGDTFVEIELLEATNYDDIITGSDAGDRITALDGNDTMYGGLGDDKLFGGDGVDTIFGGEGSDKLFGGAGNDILTGGTGRDIYQLGASEGQDTITDFNQAESDIIVFTNASGANAIGDLTIASTNGGADTLIIYAEGSILLEGIDSSLIGAADFNFV